MKSRQAILIFSGIGSRLSQHIKVRRLAMALAAGAPAIVFAVYALFLTPLLSTTIALPPVVKGVIAAVIVGAPAFVMGMPFPLGLRYLSQHRRLHVPWAWAINGCLSVVSTALAALFAVEFGFVAVMLTAAGAYGVVALASVSA